MYELPRKNVKINGMDCDVHCLPGSESEFQRDYGLRIVDARSNLAHAVSSLKSVRPRVLEFYCLSHMYKGRGFYWTPKSGARLISPGECVIASPRFVHCYRGWGDDYYEDHVCFTGPLADGLFKAGLVKDGVWPFGLERRILPLIGLFRNPSLDAQMEANLKLQELLLSIRREFFSTHDGASARRRVEAQMERIRREPEKWLTVEDMAEAAELGPTQFRLLFKEISGVSPKRYMEEVKARRAIELLADGLSAQEIAKRLSYSDQFHFSKRFKACSGMAPSEYRRKVLNVGDARSEG